MRRGAAASRRPFLFLVAAATQHHYWDSCVIAAAALGARRHAGSNALISGRLSIFLCARLRRYYATASYYFKMRHLFPARYIYQPRRNITRMARMSRQAATVSAHFVEDDEEDIDRI